MSASFVNVPIPTAVFLRLADALRADGIGQDPVEAVPIAIDYWLQSRPFPPEVSRVAVGPSDRGYLWKDLFLPHGTHVRMHYKGRTYYSAIEGDFLRFEGVSVSPSQFAFRVTNTHRNAWRDLQVRRPDDSRWHVADDLRGQLQARASQDRAAPHRTQFEEEETEMTSKNRWLDDVLLAVRQLGGKAHLSKIYREVDSIRLACGRSRPKSTDAIVRRVLEMHSSDSDAYGGHQDLFRMAEGRGAGVWAIR